MFQFLINRNTIYNRTVRRSNMTSEKISIID